MDKWPDVEGCNFAAALRRWAAPQQSPNKFGSAFGLHHRCIRKTKHKKEQETVTKKNLRGCNIRVG